jgi:hypothetical protein
VVETDLHLHRVQNQPSPPSLIRLFGSPRVVPSISCKSCLSEILRGAKPGDLPIDEPPKFDFIAASLPARC